MINQTYKAVNQANDFLKLEHQLSGNNLKSLSFGSANMNFGLNKKLLTNRMI